MEKYGKTAIFPGAYGQIGEILHGRLRPDWGLKGSTCFLVFWFLFDNLYWLHIITWSSSRLESINLNIVIK